MIQDMENREEESTREEQRHNLLSAERKYKKQKKENSILRNIYSSIVLATKIDWARKERVRELMLCNEDEPGVPENELSTVCWMKWMLEKQAQTASSVLKRKAAPVFPVISRFSTHLRGICAE